MGRTTSQIFLCIFTAVLLNLYLLLPHGKQVFVGSETNLESTAISNTENIIEQIKLCKNLDLREHDTSMAVAITAAESSFVGILEGAIENFLYKNFRGAVNWMNLSVGPAQLKQDRYSEYSHLNPLDLCNAVIIVLKDIRKIRKKTVTFRWSKYLLDYNGSTSSNVHGLIYASYVISIFNKITELHEAHDAKN